MIYRILSLILLALLLSAGRVQPTALDTLKTLGLSDAVRSNEDRLGAIANETLAQGKATPLFGGRRGVDATALLMLGIAFHESGFMPEVERCERRGDGGHAYGLPQMHPEHFGEYSAEDFCSSRAAQWERQADLLRRVKLWCKWSAADHDDRGPMIWLGAYNSGKCTTSVAGLTAYANFVRMARHAGIRVEKHGKRWVAY